MKKILTLAASCLILAGCAAELHSSLPAYMKYKNLPPVSVANFPHCEGYGCPVYKNVILSKSDWKKIDKAFGKKAKNAEDERAKLPDVIAVFEQVVGALTGTDGDRLGTFIQTGEGQLDCVDESTNTTIYLMLLAERGLLKFHSIEQPQVRYPLISGRGWMHQTAVITDVKTKAQFAVDSWFEDNGQPAYVVPLPEWLNGWTAEKAKKPVVKDGKSA
jgi:hypothetical protein